MRAAADLLSDRTPRGRAALSAALGFAGLPLALDDRALAALGLEDDATGARIVRGPGALRALLLDAASARPLHDHVRRIAARLAARAPHQLWLLVAGGAAGELAIAAWSADRTPPRIASLLLDPAHIVASDAETLCALAAAVEWSGDGDVLTHARWLEVLGRDALTRRFYRTLERLVDGLAASSSGRATHDERRELALLATSRLLFLSFLQAKGWLDGRRDFLPRVVARRMDGAGGVHRRCLLPLFFGTLNTPPRHRAALARGFGRVPFLNGGLFTPTSLERRRRDVLFSDDALAALFDDLLHRYRFTAREADGVWAEAAVDPVMLGRAFESLMGAGERRGSGAFYTPHSLVERLTGEALREALVTGSDDAAAALLAGDALRSAEAARLLARLAALRVVDPACGSGAFLVHALERLADLRARAGDGRPLAERRRAVLARSIFGVDVNPMAVWLCELRLWLSVSVEDEETDPMRVRPLPNLDRNVRVGDALSGEVRATADGDSRAIARLRERYARAAGPSKSGLGRALDRAERRHAVETIEREIVAVDAARRELAIVRRTRDLFGERRREGVIETESAALRDRTRELRRRLRSLRDGAALPFSWHSHFADVVDDGGFDIVVGNPPWVRLHRIPPPVRALLRQRFVVFRAAAWREGSGESRGGAGFAAQADLAALFVERGLTLARGGGVLALLLPMKLWRSLAGGGVRALLLRDAVPLRLEDWSRAESSFDAAVYPSVIVARRRASPPDETDDVAECTVSVRRRSSERQWRVAADALPLDGSAGSPWLLLPPDARAAFDRLAAASVPLAASALGAPVLGVKSGCNDAFALHLLEVEGAVARVRGGGREGVVEAALLRPLLRGETVGPWRAEPNGERLLWTHGDDRRPLERLPPLAGRWLAHWRSRLAERTDARGRERWWALFRPEAADATRPRVVWADIGRAPGAAVLPAGDPRVPINSCYVLPCPSLDDAFALAALLNGPLGAAWLRALAEPARGGYARFLAWTVGRLPLPRDWPRARAILAPFGARASAGDVPPAEALLEPALAAYALDASAVIPLLDWATHDTGRDSASSGR